MMASLFGRNKLRAVAQEVQTLEILGYVAIVETWHTDYHSGTLKFDKETSREQAYNQDFFIKILGYREKPATPFSFEPKATTEKRQLPDAVLSHTDAAKGITNIAAVIELKGALIDLDRPQRREGNMSPVQQGFKYKTQYRACPFVIVSNFWEFRLYNDTQLDYERWTLDQLVDPADDYINFKSWYVLLMKENFTAIVGKSKTEALLTDIRAVQRDIGEEFYDHYKRARVQLLQDIWRNNPGTRAKFDLAIEKGQKIIDRIVFASFAEDSGLLPDNTVARVVAHAKSSKFVDNPLWPALQDFFKAIDQGSSKLEIPSGYNGGLFADDPMLDALTIPDAPLEVFTTLGANYKFSEDLTVNILGHIFEQSIADLENIKSKIDKDADPIAWNEPRPAGSRRRREGVYYTPDYIVRYIVENSLGSFLREHEERLKKKHGLSMRLGQAGYEDREQRVYLEYQTIVQNIKVVDPACGSGAFLVHVFDYLLAENRRVDAILGGSLLNLDHYVREILNRNIYGVDLNAESVEITKLSLWLKTAQKDKQLTSLDDNVLCGNSLIDDPLYAGDKAFDWQHSFPEVFKTGGFDIVVGNPPYVDSESMVKNDSHAREFIARRFKNTKGNWDLLVPFIELAFELMKPGGKMSFITSNKWLALDYGVTTRNFIYSHINSMCDCTMENVFESANISSVIFGASHGQSSSIALGGLKSGQIVPVFEYKKKNDAEEAVLKNNLSLIFSPGLAVVARLNKMPTLKDSGLFSVSGAFTTSEAYELIPLVTEGSTLSGSEYYRLINTGTIDKYTSLWGLSVFSYLKDKYKYPIVSRVEFKSLFKRRYDRLNRPKIAITGIRYFECFLDATNEFLPTKSTVVVTADELEDLQWLTAVLNSAFIRQYIRANYLSSSMGGGINFTPDLVRDLPLVLPDDVQAHTLATMATTMQDLKAQLAQASFRFQRLVELEFGLKSWPTKLNRWWEGTFEDLVAAIRVTLSIMRKDELLTLFEKQQPECAALALKADIIDADIDSKVRALYGLTPKDYDAFIGDARA